MSAPEGFCSHCHIDIPSFAGLTACPNCGTRGIPCAYDEEMTITINLHELRILTYWAERWSMRLRELGEPNALIYAIALRLKRNNPALAGLELTLADELDSLRQAGIPFQTNLPGLEDHQPPEAPHDL